MSKEKNKQVDLGVSLYDVNKSLMAKETPLDPILLNRAVADMAKIMGYKKYWMLLNNERKDYSVFNICNPNNIAEEVLITLTNRGEVLSIERQGEEFNFEIWIRDHSTKENFAYYLFDYTFGIIDV